MPENVLRTSKSGYFRAFIQLITKATPPQSFFRIGVILLCKLSLLPLPDNSFSKGASFNLTSSGGRHLIRATFLLSKGMLFSAARDCNYFTDHFRIPRLATIYWGRQVDCRHSPSIPHGHPGIGYKHILHGTRPLDPQHHPIPGKTVSAPRIGSTGSQEPPLHRFLPLSK